MYFRNYRLSNTWLNHCLESTISERPSRVNVLVSAKHLLNLPESTFIIHFDHSDGKVFAKHLLYSNLKS